jgi:hypothetical protein
MPLFAPLPPFKTLRRETEKKGASQDAPFEVFSQKQVLSASPA